MLTEADRKWLDARSHDSLGECRKCGYRDEQGCSFVPRLYCEWCYLEHENQDWADAAEFEARVAKRMVLPPPCRGIGECVEPSPHITCEACHLKYARITVEAKMEAESAGR